uniref:Uncharacterized protein n=1 Tax=Peronospora matthiolae TaxID=2874970 RepID=A0AAV1VB41_9STRA
MIVFIVNTVTAATAERGAAAADSTAVTAAAAGTLKMLL